MYDCLFRMSSRVKVISIILICVTDAFGLITSDVMSQAPAYTWRDTLYVRVVDSVYNPASQAIEFSLEMKRPNADWNRDAVMGDMDFYFFYDRTAFDPASITPVFDRAHTALDLSVNGSRTNMLSAEVRFHAGRFLISTRVTNKAGDANKYEFSVDEGWVELCRVKIPMTDPNRNPGIVWDMTATGAMTAGGDPILLKLAGDVKNNPKGTVNAKSLVVAPQWVCQGDLLYLYVEDVVTSGDDLRFTWRDSVERGAATTLGEFNAPATGVSPRGYQYEILGKGDTLVIPNVPHVVDNLHFICDLYDYKVKDGMTVTEKALVRDSLYAYFVSGTPSTPNGMSGEIDTVWKCQGVPAQLYLHVFGTDRKSMQSEFGSKLTVHYGFIDKDMNARTGTLDVLTADLLKQQTTVSGLPVGTILFKAGITFEDMGKFWVNSISTEYCSNGAGYVPFDTVYIKEVEGNIEYNLPKLSVSIGEEIALDTATATPKNYTIDFLPAGSYLGGSVYEDAGVYKYDATSAIAGMDTVVYTYKQASCEMQAFQPVEVVENYYLTMKVLLEGTYLGLDDKNRDTMNCFYTEQERIGENVFPRNNLFRLLSPYNDEVTLDAKYLQVSDLPLKGTLCDWIYIELKEALYSEEFGRYECGDRLDSLSAFILNDGSVCGLDGNDIKFKNIGSQKVYVIIKHRNHLKVISNPVQLLNHIPAKSEIVIDFTDITKVFQGEDALKKVIGKNCLIGGDVNGDGFISVQDRSLISKSMGLLLYEYDINQDRFVMVQDRNIVGKNTGSYSKLP